MFYTHTHTKIKEPKKCIFRNKPKMLSLNKKTPLYLIPNSYYIKKSIPSFKYYKKYSTFKKTFSPFSFPPPHFCHFCK